MKTGVYSIQRNERKIANYAPVYQGVYSRQSLIQDQALNQDSTVSNGEAFIL
jgi:hypothetical protein